MDGTVSMARDGPDTATSDFFICIGDQPELDFGGKRNPDGQGFAAFGRVTSGMDVVQKIQAAAANGQRSRPPSRLFESPESDRASTLALRKHAPRAGRIGKQLARGEGVRAGFRALVARGEIVGGAHLDAVRAGILGRAPIRSPLTFRPRTAASPRSGGRRTSRRRA